MTDPEFELKTISADAVDAAIQKMERYRLLNEPEEAESICRDILRVQPDHHEARIGLLLCLSDQLPRNFTVAWTQAREVLGTVDDPFEKDYYEGILCERRAKVHHSANTPSSGSMTHRWLLRAMECYERAEHSSPAGNDSARLRWNTCARMIMNHPDIQCAEPDAYTPDLLE